MKKIVRLTLVRNQRKADQAKFVRRDLFRCARSQADERGDELSGFALISWDRSGSFKTALQHGYGPFGWTSIPEHMRDALQRHVSVELAQTRTFEPNEDEGA